MGEKTNQKGFIGIIVIIVVILGIIIISRIFDWGFLTSEITSYSVQCKEKLELGSCKEPLVVLNPTTYKVSSGEQEVLYWIEGVGGIDRLIKCAVKDRKNWSCKYNDESGEFGFTDGRFWEVVLNSSISQEELEKIYYVSRFEYAKIRCSENGNLSISCFILSVLLD
jgi:hypothetical protein